MRIVKHCRCGAGVDINTAEVVAWHLLRIFQSQHQGPGHGDCSATVAAKARAKADSRGQALAREEAPNA